MRERGGSSKSHAVKQPKKRKKREKNPAASEVAKALMLSSVQSSVQITFYMTNVAQSGPQ